MTAVQQNSADAAATPRDGSSPLRIGTRGSLLARTQAGTIRDALIAAGHPAELVVIETPGDLSAQPVAEIGVGVFTSALRAELAAGAVDIAVHSYKDLPTEPDPRCVVAAVPSRQDPRDALVARDGLVLGELPAGARIGTSAPRRVAQLRALGLGVEVVPVRGNLETRLRKVVDGDLDAVVVARAGLARIDRLDAVTEPLDPVQLLSAPGQGALAVECRSVDSELVELLAGLNDPATHASVTAERGLLAELQGGCTAPIGALAEVVESLDDDGRIVDELSLRGCVAAIDGSDVIKASAVGSPADAEELGRALGRELLDLGARDLLGSAASDAQEFDTEARPGAAPEPEPPGSRTQAVNAPADDLTQPSPMENSQ